MTELRSCVAHATTPRIAVVQHGDYLHASQIIASGQAEPYFGMKYSLEVLQDLFRDFPHLVISLNAPAYDCVQGQGRYLGLPLHRYPKPIPGMLAMWNWSGVILRQVRDFRPTHLLLRSGSPVLGAKLLRYSAERNVNVLAIMANIVGRPRTPWGRILLARFIHYLNRSNVFLVGNHKQPATESMVECGVDPAKAVAWDWPNPRHPKDFPAKTHQVATTAEVIYVGSVSKDKGVGDLLDAIAILERDGWTIHCSILGDGPDQAEMRARAKHCHNVQFHGRVANTVAFDAMLHGTLVCVPSRPEFSEGLPLTLTEALASRTPVLISDHPVFCRAFTDGQGVKFFKARHAQSLAIVMASVLKDPVLYGHLSNSTIDAFKRVECHTEFGGLVKSWQAATLRAEA